LRCEPIGFVRREEGLEEVEGFKDIMERDERLRAKVSEIELLDDFCEGIEGVRKGSFVWVIWYAHLVKDRPIKVHPFKDPSFPEMGVFATRSPARPCPLGLSLVLVKEVGRCSLKVMGLDAVDGTPVLDLKLYYEGLDSPEKVLSLESIAEGTD